MKKNSINKYIIIIGYLIILLDSAINLFKLHFLQYEVLFKIGAILCLGGIIAKLYPKGLLNSK